MTKVERLRNEWLQPDDDGPDICPDCEENLIDTDDGFCLECLIAKAIGEEDENE